MERATIVSDESGHDYLIPYVRQDEFYNDLHEADNTDNHSKFIEKWDGYRIEADYSIYSHFD